MDNPTKAVLAKISVIFVLGGLAKVIGNVADQKINERWLNDELDTK